MRRRGGLYALYALCAAMAAIAFLSESCMMKSSVKTISSNDWFRNGVDRFYLATVPSSVRYPKAQTVRVGQDALIGLGCFGESKNQNETVTVQGKSCAGETYDIALNERIRLDDFPLAADPQNPNAGECVVLLGSTEVVETLRTEPEKFLHGMLDTAAISAATATNACGLSLAVGHSFFLKKVSLDQQMTSAADAVGFARRLLMYLGANNLVPAVYNGTHPVYALKANDSLQGKSPEELASLDKLLVGQAVLPCGEYEKSIWELLGIAQSRDARKVLFRALAEADRRTAQRVRQSEFFPEFADALHRGDLRAAAGIYNPIFAFEFNRNVNESASQGWGGFGTQKFFDEIRTINRELSEL